MGLSPARSPAADGVQGGGLVIVTGVSGGVGATTLAVNLAGHFGVSMNRHTVILDPDLHLGDASLLLNVKAGSGAAHGSGSARPDRRAAGGTCRSTGVGAPARAGRRRSH